MTYLILKTGLTGQLFSARRGSVTLRILTLDGYVLRDYRSTEVRLITDKAQRGKKC